MPNSVQPFFAMGGVLPQPIQPMPPNTTFRPCRSAVTFIRQLIHAPSLFMYPDPSIAGIFASIRKGIVGSLLVRRWHGRAFRAFAQRAMPSK